MAGIYVTARRRTAVGLSVFLLGGAGLVGCSPSDPPPPLEEVLEEGQTYAYTGDYTSSFTDKFDELRDEKVILTADVSTLVSTQAFTLIGTDVEPLLVVSTEPMTELEPGMTVTVTGIVHSEFHLDDAEDQMEVDLEAEVLESWDGEPYIEALKVEAASAAGN